MSFEDRQDLLGHKSARITTHYSAAEISSLIEAADQVCQTASPAKVPQSFCCARLGARNRLKRMVEREGIEPSTPAL